MKQSTYEWDYEVINKDGDILSHNYADNLSDYSPNESGRLVLVKSVWRDGCCERAWAYVSDNKLPDFFTNAFGSRESKVPQRFSKEFVSYFSATINL